MTKTRITYPVLTDPKAWDYSYPDYEVTILGIVETPVGMYKIYGFDNDTFVVLDDKKFVAVAGSATDDILIFLRKQAHRDQLERLGEKVDPTDDEGFTVARWKVG